MDSSSSSDTDFGDASDDDEEAATWDEYEATVLGDEDDAQGERALITKVVKHFAAADVNSSGSLDIAEFFKFARQEMLDGKAQVRVYCHMCMKLLILMHAGQIKKTAQHGSERPCLLTLVLFCPHQAGVVGSATGVPAAGLSAINTRLGSIEDRLDTLARDVEALVKKLSDT